MDQPRPTDIRLIETGDLIIDNSGCLPGTGRTTADYVLRMIRGFAARATHGMLERPEMLVAEADCWMITYGSGDYEIVTLGNAFAGICRHPDRPVTYVAAMRLVRA